MQSPPRLYLSHVRSDQTWADQLASLLESKGLALANLPPNAERAATPDDLRAVINSATHTLVLLGPRTRDSRWVDREIDLTIAPREDGPGAGLIGVILPDHPDFKLPYYDPRNVPIRLHDLVQSDYALVRKWSLEPDEILRWLNEADWRRQSRRPEPSLGAAAQIYRQRWDESADEARPGLEAL